MLNSTLTKVAAAAVVTMVLAAPALADRGGYGGYGGGRGDGYSRSYDRDAGYDRYDGHRDFRRHMGPRWGHWRPWRPHWAYRRHHRPYWW